MKLVNNLGRIMQFGQKKLILQTMKLVIYHKLNRDYKFT